VRERGAPSQSIRGCHKACPDGPDLIPRSLRQASFSQCLSWPVSLPAACPPILLKLRSKCVSDVHWPMALASMSAPCACSWFLARSRCVSADACWMSALPSRPQPPGPMPFLPRSRRRSDPHSSATAPTSSPI
jgi:hypothetical protein